MRSMTKKINNKSSNEAKSRQYDFQNDLIKWCAPCEQTTFNPLRGVKCKQRYTFIINTNTISIIWRMNFKWYAWNSNAKTKTVRSCEWFFFCLCVSIFFFIVSIWQTLICYALETLDLWCFEECDFCKILTLSEMLVLLGTRCHNGMFLETDCWTIDFIFGDETTWVACGLLSVLQHKIDLILFVDDTVCISFACNL